MAVFCVVISGRLPGDKDDVSVWAPVKAAFKLDDESFTQRVLTAMPLIVRQGLDEPSADKLTYQLRANGVDASKQPDASPMAFIERGGTTRGPVPLAVLGLFIHPNERYRIDGDQTWQTWFLLEPAFELSLPTSIEDVRFKGIDGEEVPPPLPTDSNAEQYRKTPPAWLAELSNSDESPPPLPSNNDSELPPFAGVSPAFTVSPKVPEPESLPPTSFDSTFSTDEFTRPRRAPPEGSYAGWWIGGFIVALVVIVLAVWFYAHREGAPNNSTAVSMSSEQRQTAANQSPSSAIPITPVSTSHTGIRPSDISSQSSVGISPSAIATTSSIQTSENSNASVTDNCAGDSPPAQAPEETVLLANGQRHLTGKSVRGGALGELYVVEAALGYDGQCRPDPYQIYVFRNQQLVGTISPVAMHARSDGGIVDFKLVDPYHLQVDIDHYKPTDAACCASGKETQVIDLSKVGANSDVQATDSASTPRSTSASPAGPSPSFDCHQAQSPTELTICGDNELSLLDSQMAVAYRTTMARASSGQASVLKQSQREWLRDRAQQCGDNKNCIASQLSSRINVLQQPLPNESVIQSVNGSQLLEGKLDAANECFKNSNFDCSMQIARSVLAQDPKNAAAAELLQKSQAAQAQALHGSWNVH
jgi:uncharacterized protein